MASRSSKYAIMAWGDGSVALRPTSRRRTRVRKSMPGENCHPDGEPIALLDEESNTAAAKLYSLLGHLDDIADGGRYTFSGALNTLLETVLHTGIKIGVTASKPKKKTAS